MLCPFGVVSDYVTAVRNLQIAEVGDFLPSGRSLKTSPNGEPAGASHVLVPPHTEVTVLATMLGDIAAHRLLMVKNMNDNMDGAYEVDLS